MDFKFDNNIPIYIQLVEQLKICIISGKLKPGQRLQSVRDLAIQLKVNPNTIQKALMELENLKLIYTERTNGKYVIDDKELIESYKEKYALELSKSYLSNMEMIGFSRNESIEFVKNIGGNK